MTQALLTAKPARTVVAISNLTSAVAGFCPGAIYEAAVKEGADLIIISTYGRTGLRRALIGSVAEGTVRNAACPVLVVPCFSPKGKRQLSEPRLEQVFA